ncbi:MAG: hypothetical protein AB1797_01015 [bacterium]
MCFGARKSARVDENLKRIDEFVTNSAVLGCDAETARRYGEIKNAFRVKGHPIPEEEWHNSITKDAIAEAIKLSGEAFLKHADEFVLEPIPA